MNINNTLIENQVICSNDEDNKCILYFEANLTIHSFAYFKIRKANNDEAQNMTLLKFPDGENEKIFMFNDANGIKIYANLQNFTYIKQGHELPFKLSYRYFKSKSDDSVNSGLYIFRPDDSCKEGSINYSTPKTISISEGNNFLIQITVISLTF
jgi:hypothetical protein